MIGIKATAVRSISLHRLVEYSIPVQYCGFSALNGKNSDIVHTVHDTLVP